MLPKIANLCAYFALHLGAVLLGQQFHYSTESPAAVWFSCGTLLGFLLLTTPRNWPYFVAAALIAELAGSWLSQSNVFAFEGEFIAWYVTAAFLNVTEALLGALIVLRLVKFPVRMSRLSGVLGILVGACFGAAALCSLLGALALEASNPETDLALAWRVWWFSDALGTLSVAPLIVSWSSVWRRGIRAAAPRRGSVPEVCVLIASALLLGQLSFGHEASPTPGLTSFPYLLLPIVGWTAIRFRATLLTTLGFVLLLMLTSYTAAGRGPFAQFDTSTHQDVLAMQAYAATMLAGSLLLSAVWTERDSQEQRKLEANRHLETVALLDSNVRHVAGVAHDLNNVLTTVSGVAFLLRDAPTEEETRSVLPMLDGALRRARELSEKLVTEPEKEVGTTQSFALGELVSGLCPQIAAALPAGYELVTNSPAEGIVIRADPVSVDRTLTNLVKNAVEAMTQDGRIFVRLRAEGAQAVLEVEDEGPGVQGGDLARIFQPFFTTKTDKGHGVGLWTVRQLVERDGGSIGVESPPGRGACFRVTWPLAARAGAT